MVRIQFLPIVVSERDFFWVFLEPSSPYLTFTSRFNHSSEPILLSEVFWSGKWVKDHHTSKHKAESVLVFTRSLCCYDGPGRCWLSVLSGDACVCLISLSFFPLLSSCSRVCNFCPTPRTCPVPTLLPLWGQEMVVGAVDLWISPRDSWMWREKLDGSFANSQAKMIDRPWSNQRGYLRVWGHLH